MYEYKTVVYREDFFSSALLGAANVHPERFSAFLNKNARDGWRVRTMERDMQRVYLVFKREAYIVIMEREVK